MHIVFGMPAIVQCINVYFQICLEQLITGNLTSLDVTVIASSCRLVACNVCKHAGCFCVYVYLGSSSIFANEF